MLGDNALLAKTEQDSMSSESLTWPTSNGVMGSRRQRSCRWVPADGWACGAGAIRRQSPARLYVLQGRSTAGPSH